MLFHSKQSLLVKLIQYFTGSDYSHVGIVLKDPTFLDKPLKGLYLWESGAELSGDVPDNKFKLGVNNIDVSQRDYTYDISDDVDAIVIERSSGDVNINGFTPLMCFTYVGIGDEYYQTMLAKMLIENNADINILDTDENKVLDHAIGNKYPNAARNLLVYGPKVLFAIILMGLLTGNSVLWMIIGPLVELIIYLFNFIISIFINIIS